MPSFPQGSYRHMPPPKRDPEDWGDIIVGGFVVLLAILALVLLVTGIVAGVVGTIWLIGQI